MSNTAIEDALMRAGYDGSGPAFVAIQAAAARNGSENALALWISRALGDGAIAPMAFAVLLARYVLADLRGNALRQRDEGAVGQTGLCGSTAKNDDPDAPSTERAGGDRIAVSAFADINGNPPPAPTHGDDDGQGANFASSDIRLYPASSPTERTGADNGDVTANADKERDPASVPTSTADTAITRRVAAKIDRLKSRGRLNPAEMQQMRQISGKFSNSVLLTLKMSDGRYIGQVRVRELQHYARESSVVAELCKRIYARNEVRLDARVVEVESEETITRMMDEIRKEAAHA